VHEFVRFADEHILQKSMESPHSSPSVAWSENSITQYSRAFYLLRQQNTVIAHHKIPGWKQMVIYTIAKSSHTHSLLESHKDTLYYSCTICIPCHCQYKTVTQNLYHAY
jgi:hypothetical protein